MENYIMPITIVVCAIIGAFVGLLIKKNRMKK